MQTPPPVSHSIFNNYEVESPPPTPETPTSLKGLCGRHTLHFQANYRYYCDPEMEGEKEMICYKCEQGCKECDCRWEAVQDDLLTWAAEEYDFDDVDVGKIATKSVRCGCYKWYIHQIFGNDLGSANRVMLPKCVVDGSVLLMGSMRYIALQKVRKNIVFPQSRKKGMVLGRGRAILRRIMSEKERKQGKLVIV